MSRIKVRIILAALALAAVSAIALSCGKEEESVVFLLAEDIKNVRRDTVMSGEHQVYEVYARTLNQKIVRLSLTESGANGLKEVETVREGDGSAKSGLLGKKKIQGFRFDYETPLIYRENSSVKDSVSIFTMLFEAEDETGEIQSLKRTLYVIKREPEVPSQSLPAE